MNVSHPWLPNATALMAKTPMGAYIRIPPSSLKNRSFNATTPLSRNSAFCCIFSSFEKRMDEIVIPIMIAKKIMAMRSPLAKAWNRLSGTICNKISANCGVSFGSTVTSGNVRFLPGLKRSANPTPIPTAAAVVAA